MAITREQAEAALAAVRDRYKNYDDAHEITLIENWEDQVAWLICWEDGPFEWAYRAAMGGVNEEVSTTLVDEFGADAASAVRVSTEQAIRFPSGVWVEPYHSYSLGLYEG
jgi:hypothetical protein